MLIVKEVRNLRTTEYGYECEIIYERARWWQELWWNARYHFSEMIRRIQGKPPWVRRMNVAERDWWGF